MVDVTLYVVAIASPDAGRRRRLRGILRYFGDPVLRDVFEVPGTAATVLALQRALGPDLEEEDDVRIYPICARCRDRARAFGTEGLSEPGGSWIF